MRITYLQLKNFAMIYTGLNMKKIEIDMSKADNKIIMLIGPNGSGKTSILSCLHPYSYNTGVDDGKSDSDLILDGKDGYKEIHYEMNGIKYIIKHFFYNKSGRRSVKSFIQRDGIELNENGNVTSFMNITLEVFGIEPSYLTLLRLGSNVKNFIDKKHSERKDFSANLMSEIEDYLKFYKNGSDDIRSMKSILSNYTSKLDKINILDRELYKNEIISAEEDIIRMEEKLESLNTNIGNISGKLSSLISNEILFNEELKSNRLEKTMLENRLNSDRELLMESDNNNIESDIKALESEIIQLENEKSGNISMKEFMYKNLSSYYDQKSEREGAKSLLNSNEDYDLMVDKVGKLEEEINNGDKEFINYDPEFNEEDLTSILSICQTINDIMDDIYGRSSLAINAVVDKRSTGNSIYSYIDSNLNNTIESINKIEYRIKNILAGPREDSGFSYIILHPEDCTVKECPYLEFYEDHNCENVDTEVDKLRAKIKSLSSNKEFYRDMLVIDSKISEIFNILNTYKNLINKTGCGYFVNKEHIIRSIRSKSIFFNEEEITEKIDTRIRYAIYLENKNNINLFKKELDVMKNNMESIKRIHEDLDRISNVIYDLESEIEKITLRDKEIDTLVEDKTNLLVKKERLLTIEKTISDNENKLNVIECKLESSYRILNEVEDLKELQNRYITDKRSLEFEIRKHRDLLQNKKFCLMEYDNIRKDYDKISKRYDEFLLIRESVSGNKGIPLLYQEVYQRNTKSIMNQFLDIKYKGELQVNSFIINEKEFRIPYTKKGIQVSDVLYSSQGEKSFITLALSFALMLQSMDKYNIMLLDEIDATLDASSRRVFLDILEKQIDNMNADQVFVISHNNMFDNYPVDVIYTGEGEHGLSNNVIWTK